MTALSAGDEEIHPATEALGFGPILNVSIERYETAGEEFCTQFEVSQDGVIAYFKSTEPGSKADYVDGLHSPCKVHGSIAFENGQTALYYIQSSGISQIIPTDGDAIFAFAVPTWADPNEGAYFNAAD
ncbi:hypothetical protein ACG74X_15915 [Marivita sp. S0852]